MSAPVDTPAQENGGEEDRSESSASNAGPTPSEVLAPSPSGPSTRHPANAEDTGRKRTARQVPPQGSHFEVLAQERQHLERSRAALRAMRQEVESLDLSDVATNHVNAAILARDMDTRIASLADLPDSPLFFGRIDLTPYQGDAGDRFYIGRRHVHDAEGDPLVVDWRAPVSRPFYSASRREPMDIALRRRFGCAAGELTAYEDEHLTDLREVEQPSTLLQAEIERPRMGPMRDIVATIQPEQDEIVRADIDHTLCVQGAPGTGKTAVGLHRVAYLLYAYPTRLARSGTLVIGPNDAFLHYISQVLPSLGESDVHQVSIGELTCQALLKEGGRVRGTESTLAATVKGDVRMAEVLRSAVYGGIKEPEEPVVISRGVRRWRIPPSELKTHITEALNRKVHYNSGRENLAHRIGRAVLTRVESSGEIADDRMQETITRSVAVRTFVNTCWPVVSPAKVVLRLLSDREFLAEHAEGILTAEEQEALLWAKPGRGIRSARWSRHDAVLVDEATSHVERTEAVGHVVVDEAQDLSALELRAIGRRCATGTATVLGDLAQGTTPWATTSWQETLRHLGKPDALVEELTDGFRVPREVIDFASLLLPEIAPTLQPVTSLREATGRFTIRRVAAGELIAEVVDACREMLKCEGTVGLITADERIAVLHKALDDAGLCFLAPGAEAPVESRLTLTPATHAKGLEYDHVVLCEPADIVYGEHDLRTGLRRLYVSLTRAVSGLSLLHSEPLPDALR